jgi:hypothetical protein
MSKVKIFFEKVWGALKNAAHTSPASAVQAWKEAEFGQRCIYILMWSMVLVPASFWMYTSHKPLSLTEKINQTVVGVNSFTARNGAFRSVQLSLIPHGCAKHGGTQALIVDVYPNGYIPGYAVGPSVVCWRGVDVVGDLVDPEYYVEMREFGGVAYLEMYEANRPDFKRLAQVPVKDYPVYTFSRY